jgi:hypothetical protein
MLKIRPKCAHSSHAGLGADLIGHETCLFMYEMSKAFDLILIYWLILTEKGIL